MKKISVVLATRNEEQNIARVLDSVKSFAYEMIVFDEGSTDKTQDIARQKGAKVFNVAHEPIFHKTKQKALENATGDWILQMDADEEITKELVGEIKKVVEMSDEQIRKRRPKGGKKWSLFQRHQKMIENRDGKIGKSTGEVVAFFIPRLNMFLGSPLRYGGVYPDPAIRLVKKGKARFPAKSVHEIMQIDGEIAWLFSDMKHYDSPTYARYIARLNRYTDLQAVEIADNHTSKNLWQLFLYTVVKPKMAFFRIYLRRRGYKDGMRGFVWALSSAMHYPIAYFKYWEK